MTLIELMIASVTATIVLAGAVSFLIAVTRSSANDEERNISLVQQTAALHRITQELSQTYELNSPTEESETNVIDVDVWLASSGSAQVDKRIVYNCEAASGVSGQQECLRYEMPASDKTELAGLNSDSKARSSIAVTRLINGTKTAGVFKLYRSPREQETGKSRPTYGTIEIKTPGQGERSSYASQAGYPYDTTLNDSFYMRNLELDG